MKNRDTIDLLNSEGAILTATKVPMTQHTGNAMRTTIAFQIMDQFGKSICFMTEAEIFDFTRGKTEITDSKGRVFKYSLFAVTMKPDLKTLDEFIGVDTRGKTY